MGRKRLRCQMGLNSLGTASTKTHSFWCPCFLTAVRRATLTQETSFSLSRTTRVVCVGHRCGICGITTCCRGSSCGTARPREYAWAQFKLSQSLAHAADANAWLKKAAAQGEAEAMAVLGAGLCTRRDGVSDKTRGKDLLREAAELVCASAQFDYARMCCPSDTESVERALWMRRAAMQGHYESRLYLSTFAEQH